MWLPMCYLTYVHSCMHVSVDLSANHTSWQLLYFVAGNRELLEMKGPQDVMFSSSSLSFHFLFHPAFLCFFLLMLLMEKLDKAFHSFEWAPNHLFEHNPMSIIFCVAPTETYKSDFDLSQQGESYPLWYQPHQYTIYCFSGFDLLNRW